MQRIIRLVGHENNMTFPTKKNQIFYPSCHSHKEREAFYKLAFQKKNLKLEIIQLLSEFKTKVHY